MRIIFIGQAPFGRESLEALIKQGEDVIGIITVEDVANQKYPNPVKECAIDHGIDLYQANYLKNAKPIDWVRKLAPDLLVLGFVTAFVPQEMIDLATYGGINYHPSLLPKYRGGSAINWAIINGETETGVTIHFIDEGVDTGPILLQEKVDIAPDDTVKSVYFKKLYPLGVQMIAKAVQQVREGQANPVVQNETNASFQPVITTKDTAIDWHQPTTKIYNLIRGANPAPGAGTRFRDEPLKIFDSRPSTETGAPGTVISIGVDCFTIATADGSIEVLFVQPINSKKIPATEFAQNMQLMIGELFGS